MDTAREHHTKRQRTKIYIMTRILLISYNIRRGATVPFKISQINEELYPNHSLIHEDFTRCKKYWIKDNHRIAPKLIPSLFC